MSIMDMPIGQIKTIARATGQTAWSEKDSKTQLVVEFRIRDDDPDYAGQTITYYQGVDHEKGLGFAWQALRACGVTGDDILDHSQIQANEVELVINAKMWEGKKQIRVDFVNAVGGRAMVVKQIASVGNLRAIAARAKAMAASTCAPVAAKPVAPPQFDAPPAASAAPGGDNIPF